jgi:hypothetical protein
VIDLANVRLRIGEQRGDLVSEREGRRIVFPVA